MSDSCCARLQRANVEFAAVERPRKAVVPKSVQIASAVAYAASHEACAAHAKTRLAAPLRSFAAPLRSPTVFLRVQHMASCAAAHGTGLAIWTDFGTTAVDGLSTAANSTFARRNRAQQLPDIRGHRDAKNSSSKWL